MLKDNFVDIYRVEDNALVRDVIAKYNAKKLEQIIVPTHPLEESQSADA